MKAATVSLSDWEGFPNPCWKGAKTADELEKYTQRDQFSAEVNALFQG